MKWGVGPYVFVGAWNEVCFVRRARVGERLVAARVRAAVVVRGSMPVLRAAMASVDQAASSVLGIVCGRGFLYVGSRSWIAVCRREGEVV